ncbi:MAG: AAA family ATPase [Candidatus Nanoarchaeia archaeon]|nr:AAA family ATPase [Candidatus Nanoarchaeia archaeon]
MKLLSLKILNVRSHKESFVEFKDGITVISGKTGSGKSTILMAIHYALFGSADLSNNEIMRRSAKKMIIELKLVQNGEEYTILRGLKRMNDSVSIDTENLKVEKNGIQINSLNRANDINLIIQEILGFPSDSKPNLMFQVLSYTKQDNIRNLIEMKKEERQDFIDKILQLSKYKSVFENLKPLIDTYLSKHELINQLSEFINDEKESAKNIKSEINELNEKISDNEKKLLVINPSIDKKNDEIKILNERIKILRQKNEQIIIQNQRFEYFKKNIEKTFIEQKNLIEKNNILKPKIVTNAEDFEKLNEKLNTESSKLKVIEYRILKLKKENEEINKLQANCPTCMQRIPDEHKKALSANKNIEIIGLEDSKNLILNTIKKLNELLIVSKKNEELKKEINNIDSAINLLEKQIISQKKELINFKEENNELIQKEIIKIEEEYNLLLSKFNELFAKKSGIESANQELKTQLLKLTGELKNKNIKISEYEEKSKEKNHVKLCLDFLNKLRINVKDIRQIIRSRFLNDFKNSFAKKFEEIRNNDDEYYVEINQDYEPVAYSSEGIEVPINYLSGGEKTSAALAYRLALSDLAGEINNLMPSELLILDEPTTGFDNEDVKSLPIALSNLSSIPQIIIVTHEALLKEIADNSIDIIKENGFSKISYS